MGNQTRITRKDNTPTKRVQLECGDWFYYKHSAPNLGDTVYCAKCRDWQDVGAKEGQYGTVIDAENEYESSPIQHRKGWYKGKCLHTDSEGDCEYQTTAHGFFRLRDKMHFHMLHSHSRFGPNDMPFLFEDAEPVKVQRKAAPF